VGGKMPNIDKFYRIKIYIYNNEHPPPHLHAIYNEFEALFDIVSSRKIAGDLPVNQMRQVNAWIKENTESALKNFYELNPRIK
jgi:hypothetical protein